MTTIRAMRPDDLWRITSTNLDHLTETYNISFYLEYLTKWPELCQIIEGMDGEIEGYSTLLPPFPPKTNLVIPIPGPPFSRNPNPPTHRFVPDQNTDLTQPTQS